MAKFKVEYYENATARKQGKVFGVFYPEIDVVEIPEVSEKLKGKVTSTGEDMYEAAVTRRTAQVERAIMDAKFAACDVVREVVGTEGVLVASPVEEEDK